ncbi:type II toxin-antitoxin system death-on-curing family toxin [Atopobium deltae]|uniref:Death-on-curing family protein n=1 Tax=Atopobium deltae TaxID=1393034 RepID=A0A133XWN0_9ACTN|nr:type II toxin-antitoxin system death-on-curing family toxin [Atopobium deltae]KXB35357.1 death-on-curing family protein [Atopobium deltae]
MKYLTEDQVVRLHQALIETSGGSLGIRDEGMLNSALKTPLQTFDKSELFPSLLDKATRLAFGLIKNHPFIDGNKRIGTHAMLIFLALNGIMLSYNDEDLIDIILKVASNQANESDLYQWIENHQE